MIKIDNKSMNLIKIIFLAASLWNLIGAMFGYFNTAFTFHHFFARELADPLIYAIYKGAWGTTFVYFFGYLVVAYNPLKHPGIVVVGGIGKIGFVIQLLQLYISGLANSVVLVVVIGDFIFLILFLYYFLQLYRAKVSIV
jgi:hypothetical protein